MIASVIIPAAGSGKRFGSEIPKQYHIISGAPLIVHTIRLFQSMPETESIIIPVNDEWKDYLAGILDEHGLSDFVTLVAGGSERQDSVYNALGYAMQGQARIILVHDAVRPFATPSLVRQIINAADEFGAAIPGLMPRDTIKQSADSGFVGSTLNRAGLISVQTPQGFSREVIAEAYRIARAAGIAVTDDASLAEYAGFPVKIVAGEDWNIKITTPLDFKIAEVIFSDLLKKNSG